MGNAAKWRKLDYQSMQDFYKAEVAKQNTIQDQIMELFAEMIDSMNKTTVTGMAKEFECGKRSVSLALTGQERRQGHINVEYKPNKIRKHSYNQTT